jgi:hypothetical protein
MSDDAGPLPKELRYENDDRVLASDGPARSGLR